MLLSHIKQLLDQTIPVDDFRKEIESETEEYKRTYRKKEVTISIHLKEDIYYLFTETEFETLQLFFHDKKLEAHEVSYICDALTLSEMTLFDNDTLLDRIESLVITND